LDLELQHPASIGRLASVTPGDEDEVDVVLDGERVVRPRAPTVARVGIDFDRDRGGGPRN